MQIEFDIPIVSLSVEKRDLNPVSAATHAHASLPF